MKDVDSSDQSHPVSDVDETTEKKLWHCDKCGYVGRARTRLERGLARKDWAAFLVLILVAFGVLFIHDIWAYVISIILLVVAATLFFAAQFRPARPYNICPQCREKSRPSKTEYIPLIPPRKKQKKRKGQRSHRSKEEIPHTDN